MEPINKYGLPQRIPEDVKRAVRQNSGFGCVLCGLSLYHYHHIDPPFAEAREHRPDSICLLCPNHHDRKNKSIQEIKAAYDAPEAKRVGYSHDPEFRTCHRPVKVRLGNVVFKDPGKVLRVGGEVLLAVEDLEEGRLGLTGRFYDRQGRLILEIDRNEWRTLAGNWDVERAGNALVIRERSYKLSLRVIAESDHAITFDNLSMNYRDVALVSSEGKVIEISYKGEPIVTHWPSEKGGMGIETEGFLDIDENGRLSPIHGPTTIGAGTLRIGNPVEEREARRARPYVRSEPKVGRNEPCPCGSGLKYKRCHYK